MYRIVLFVLLTLWAPKAYSQKNYDNSVDAIYFNFHWSYQFPARDMARRFGPGQAVGVYSEWILAGSNLIFGLNGQMIYSERVKEDVAAIFRNENGVVFGTDQTITSVYLKERGSLLGVHTGVLLPFNRQANPRSGIRLTLGLGYLRHRIKITDEFDSANQFQGPYAKGYDRLTGGFALSGFAGVQHTSKSRWVNVFAGVDYTTGFTHSLRSWDFDKVAHDDRKRNDVLWSLRAGFSLPLYIGDSNTDVEY